MDTLALKMSFLNLFAFFSLSLVAQAESFEAKDQEYLTQKMNECRQNSNHKLLGVCIEFWKNISANAHANNTSYQDEFEKHVALVGTEADFIHEKQQECGQLVDSSEFDTCMNFWTNIWGESLNEGSSMDAAYQDHLYRIGEPSISTAISISKE